MLKTIIIQLLTARLRKSITHNAKRVIFVIGESHRSAYRDALCETLTKKGVSVRANKPGYNYTLGTLLTLLNEKAGGHSLAKWVHIIFNSKISGNELIIQEFAYQGTKQEREFIQLVNPLAVITTHDHIEDIFIEGLILCYFNEKGHYICTENNDPQFTIELISYTETDQGSECVYRYKDEEYTTTLVSYGIHYAYAYMLAQALYDIYAVQQKKES